jgi:glyoxylate/hydroxypyruvate/2-ketogluconate reductase
MKPKVLVTRGVFDETLAYLARHCEVEANQPDRPLAPAELAQRASDKQGLLCCLTERIDASVLEAAPQLKAVANIAVGYNNIDVPACSARGVMVTNTPGVLDDSTADHAWALLLAAARRVTEVEAQLRAGHWRHWELKQWMGVDVHGATLGIIGMGRIGRAIARRAWGFDMKVLYCNRKRLDEASERDLRAHWVSRDELLAQADFVVLQVPYTRETHHMIGEPELARMKRTAILVNNARGGVVDDAALVRALAEGRIRGAGLDVFENEPKLDSGFLKLSNVVMTPHVASSTEATRSAMAMCAAQNLVTALTGGAPANLVNPEVLKAPPPS